METQDINLNNPNELQELDDLRQQITALKNKVDQQGRLNEERVKKAIQSKMKGLHSALLKYILCCAVFLPFFVWFMVTAHLSWPFIIFSIAMFLASFAADYFINRINVQHMGDDLVETARKLHKMKSNRKTQLAIGFCVLAAWVPWYMFEMYKYMADKADAEALPTIMTAMVIGCVFGIIIGGSIGLAFYRKMQRSNDDMINQINELTGEQ